MLAHDDVAEAADVSALRLREYPVRSGRRSAKMRDVDRRTVEPLLVHARDGDGLEARLRSLIRLLLVAPRDPDVRRRLRDELPVLRDYEKAEPDGARREIRVARCERDGF